MKGFDISSWQADDNGNPLFTYDRFVQSKNEGNEFVIIKLGESYQVDEFFQRHIADALAAGLKVGIYYYSHAYDEAEAVKEAQYVNDTLNYYGYTNWHLQMGIWYDYEEHRQLREYINQGVLTPQIMTNIISRFINTMWSYGREKVGVYGGYSLLWDETYLYSQCPSVPIFVAQYNSSCDYPNATIWQYSDSAMVAGVSVDGDQILGVL